MRWERTWTSLLLQSRESMLFATPPSYPPRAHLLLLGALLGVEMRTWTTLLLQCTCMHAAVHPAHLLVGALLGVKMHTERTQKTLLLQCTLLTCW
jgi:hypothetical protein